MKIEKVNIAIERKVHSTFRSACHVLELTQEEEATKAIAAHNKKLAPRAKARLDANLKNAVSV